MWGFRGIKGGGQPSVHLGKYSGRLIVLGGARGVWSEEEKRFIGSVWDDFLEVKKQGVKADLMAVNDVGMYCQMPLQHWTSMHAGNLLLWRKLLHEHAVDFRGLLHGNNCKSHSGQGIIDWQMYDPGAYSGLFAAQVGLCLGYEQIILCGVPQDNSGRFFDPPWVKGLTHGTDSTSKKAFKHAVSSNPELKRCVRSMSGWTRELFGGSFDEVLGGQLQCSV